MGIGIEATAGVSVAPQKYSPFLEFGLQGMHTPIADNSAKGMRDAQGSDSVEGKKWGEGNIKVVLDAETSPYWFALALGEVGSTPGVAGVYSHAITQKASNPPLTATIWQGKEIDSINFPNSVVDSLDLQFSDDIASLSMSIMSKFPVSQARTATYTALEYYTFRNAVVEIGDDIDSTTEIKVRDLTLSIKNNAEVIHQPGDNDAEVIPVKQFEVDGKMTLIFENDDQLYAYNNLGKQAMKLVLTGGKIGATAVDETITIDIPRFRVEKRSEKVSLEDLVDEEIEFIAEYDSTETKTIEITVVNGVTDYEAEIGGGS